MTTSTTAVKTQSHNLLSLQSIATAVAIIGTAYDCSTMLGPANLLVHVGRRATTALTAAPIFRLEGNFKGSGNGFWGTIFQFTTANHLTAAESEAVSGTVSSGTNVITVASTTNLTAADLIYIDNTTIANSEWGRVKSTSANVSVTIEDNLLNAQTGATLYDQAEKLTFNGLDLSAYASVRFVVDTYSGPTGQNIAVEAWLNTLDSALTT